MKLLGLLACGAMLMQAQGTYGRPPILREVGIEQRMGAQVPLDLPFVDETGKPATLRQYLGKPVILALVYYTCPSLCSMELSGLLRAAKNLKLTAGKEYEIVAVSFDPKETPQLAAAKRQSYVNDYGRPGDGWHFLTASESSSRALADTVGFHYTYDAAHQQYAHPSAMILLTAEGRVTRYLYGINYPVRDVRLSLVEASNNRIGSAVDQVMLFCFHYDPSSGKYGFMIWSVLRAAGILTASALAAFVIVMVRRDHQQQEVKT